MRLPSLSRPVVLGAALMLAAVVQLAAGPALAQGMFTPVRKVGDRVITQYDVDQRIRFLEVLGAGGADPRREAIDRLTEEAVQRAHARRRDLRVTPDEMADGMAEFAARADLDTDTFVAELGAAGVDRESFTAFVRAGLLWRKVVAEDFPDLVTVGASDIARARDVAAIRGTRRVLMSEIFLPTDPQYADAVGQITELVLNASGTAEFARLAREYSIAATREQGGRLDWLPASSLPGPVAGRLRGAAPGQVVGPIDVGGAIAFFQLRATDSTRDIPADRVKLHYKRLLLPGGRSEANMATLAQMRAEATSCPVFDRFARGLPDGALVERDALQRTLPQGDVVELARLDRNEISAAGVQDGALRVLMLCAREVQRDERPSDAQLREQLLNRRVGGLADQRLQELIADTHIVDY